MRQVGNIAVQENRRREGWAVGRADVLGKLERRQESWM